jgi:hypothetical protein
MGSSTVSIASSTPRGRDETMREEVLRFAVWMELKLRENEHKGGWKNDYVEDLLDRVDDELGEFRKTFTPDSAAREGADVANFVMMVVDQMGGLVVTPQIDLRDPVALLRLLDARSIRRLAIACRNVAGPWRDPKSPLTGLWVRTKLSFANYPTCYVHKMNAEEEIYRVTSIAPAPNTVIEGLPSLELAQKSADDVMRRDGWVLFDSPVKED